MVGGVHGNILQKAARETKSKLKWELLCGADSKDWRSRRETEIVGRWQFRGCLRVAGLNGLDHAGNVAHAANAIGLHGRLRELSRSYNASKKQIVIRLATLTNGVKAPFRPGPCAPAREASPLSN